MEEEVRTSFSIINWTSAKCTLGLLWEGEISFLDFSFPNGNYRTDNNLRQFFKEIEE